MDHADQNCLPMSVNFSDFSLLLQCSSVVCEASQLALKGVKWQAVVCRFYIQGTV